MSENTKPIWVIAEHLDGEISAVSLQLIGKARLLADELGNDIPLVFQQDLIPISGPAPIAQPLQVHGSAGLRQDSVRLGYVFSAQKLNLVVGVSGRIGSVGLPKPDVRPIGGVGMEA